MDVEKIVRIAASYGARTLVAVPPAKYRRLLPGAVSRLAEKVRQSIVDEPSARYVDTVALTTELSAGHLWRPDGLHWNDEGNRLIAELLLVELLDTGWLNEPPIATRSAVRRPANRPAGSALDKNPTRRKARAQDIFPLTRPVNPNRASAATDSSLP